MRMFFFFPPRVDFPSGLFCQKIKDPPLDAIYPPGGLFEKERRLRYPTHPPTCT